jgi:hypothetical protein
MFGAMIVSSCNNSGSVVNDKIGQYANNCTLVFKGVKEFPLDDETSYLNQYVQLYDMDTAIYYTFLNPYNNSIYFYDYNSSDYLYRVRYDKEGSRGVGNIQGYYYAGKDSIYVYSYWTSMLYLTDSKAYVLSKSQMYEPPKDGTVIHPAPYIQTSTPLKKLGKYIVCAGFVSGETSMETPTNRPTFVLFDTERQTVDYIINYPLQYSKYNWAGGFTYRIPYFDVDAKSVIISFSASHDIISFDPFSGIQTDYYAGSNRIRKIRSYDFPKDVPVNEDRAWAWHLSNASYQSIFYDKHKDRYYRIARLPLKNYSPGDNDNKKPIIIVVLDSAFNYLGEVTFPGDISFEVPNCFVSADGFNIQVLTDNEDKITYYQYDFSINEK